jgi:hypothetical protein
MKLWKVLIAAAMTLPVLGNTASNSVAGSKPKKGRGAPGPVAGAGLPVIVAAGAYWLIRRRNSRAAETDSKS